jgi:photosystem II stability/assembly factor-like uncharacterized protein
LVLLAVLAIGSGTVAQIPDGRELKETEMKFNGGICLEDLKRAGRSLAVLILLAILGTQSRTVWAGINLWTRLGPEGGSIPALVIDPRSPSTVYAGTEGPSTVYAGTEQGSGVFKSTDGGASWARCGLTASIRVLAIDPQNTGTLYAAALDGGLFKSTDGGASWAAVKLPPEAGPLPGGWHDGVDALAIDPQSTSTLYAGSSYGVFKSTDGGTNWSALDGLPSGLFGFRTLAINPQNTSIVYAGGAGVFKSTDGGAKWSAANSGMPNAAVVALAIDSQNPRTIYAVTNRGVFKSIDGGSSWSAVDLGMPDFLVSALAIDPQDPNTVYVSGNGAIFESTNGGLSWSASTFGQTVTAASAIVALAVDPQNSGTVYAATMSDGVFKTMDGGTNWRAANSGLTATGVDALAIHPQNPGTIYAAGYGVYRSTDTGATWRVGVWAQPGWVTTLAIDPQNPSTVYAGTLGDTDFGSAGVFKSTDGGTSWRRLISSTDTDSVNILAVDPQDPSTVYAGTGLRDGWGPFGVLGGVLRSTDGGTSWSVVTSGLPSAGVSVNALIIDPRNTRTVYAGTGGTAIGYVDQAYPDGIFKSVDGGESWSAASSGLPGDYISSLVMDPQNSETIYAGTGRGLFKTTDGGISWHAANSGLPDRIVADSLVIDPNTGTIYAGGRSGIFRSTDGGENWSTLNYSGLPPAGLGLLALDSQDPSTLYSVAGGAVFAITFVP